MSVATRPRVLSLCSGYGGLDQAVSRAVPGARTVCLVEREGFAAASLVKAMEEGRLDPAPIWSDLYSFDAAAWRGSVDLVVAGFPCQPVSLAGRGDAQNDERWLWPRIAEVLRDSGAGSVFLENVPGLLSANGGSAHEEVQASLAEMGFDAEWGCLSAAEVGATHKRERWFCLATRDGFAGWSGLGWEGLADALRTGRQQDYRSPHEDEAGDAGWAEGDDHIPSGSYPGVADPSGEGLSYSEPEESRGEGWVQVRGAAAELHHPPVADTGRSGRGKEAGSNEHGEGADRAGERSPGLAHPTGRGCEAGGVIDGEASDLRGLDALGRGLDIPPYPPGPRDLCLWRDLLVRYPGLAPATPKAAKSKVHGMADAGEGRDRHDRLRLLGNGVVPDQAAAAMRLLLLRFAE